MADPIADGVQKILDLYSEGWMCAHYVVKVGLERVVDGVLQTCSWQFSPRDQADYITDGLLDAEIDSFAERDEDR